jgi:hypothetical protein
MRDAGKVYLTSQSGSKLPLLAWLHQPCAGEQAAFLLDVPGKIFVNLLLAEKDDGTVQTVVKCDGVSLWY